MTAIDHMVRVHRWACQEKRRTLNDLIRLADKLRADRARLGPAEAADGMIPPGESGGAVDLRIEKLDRTIGGIESAIERAREESAAAERELAQLLQTSGGKPVETSTASAKSQRKHAGMPRNRMR